MSAQQIKSFLAAGHIQPGYPVVGTAGVDETPYPEAAALGRLEVLSASNGTKPFIGLADIGQSAASRQVDIIMSGIGVAYTSVAVQRGQLLTAGSATSGLRPVVPGERCYVIGVALESAIAEPGRARQIRINVVPGRNGRGAG